MSWHVANIQNTVHISREVAEVFVEQFPQCPVCYEEDSIQEKADALVEGNRLYFTEDHSEHIDWLEPAMLELLAAHLVMGDITFGSVSGDHRGGQFWGYRFDGKGGFRKLQGHVRWDEV